MRDSTFSRLRAPAAVFVAVLLLAACADQPSNSSTGPSFQPSYNRATAQDIRAAIAAQDRHTSALMHIPGVVGTAVGFRADGAAAVKIFLEQPNVGGLPTVLDDVPTVVEVTGRFVAFSNPVLRARPAPLGYSVGHPSITAGTIGARVINGVGSLFVPWLFYA
jgi:hypothetical protein